MTISVAVDLILLFVIGFGGVTQVIIPLWIDPSLCFWLFRKKARAKVDQRFGYLIGREPKPCPDPSAHQESAPKPAETEKTQANVTTT